MSAAVLGAPKGFYQVLRMAQIDAAVYDRAKVLFVAGILRLVSG